MVAFTDQTARALAATMRSEWIEVRPDLVCVQQPFVNVAMFGEDGAGDGNWVLIDTGMSSSAYSIRAAAERRFGPQARPSAIILTHGHFDHVGGLRTLAEHWDVPIYAHHLEHPYLSGRSPYPPADPFVGGGAMSLLSPLYPRGPINVSSRLRPLPSDHSVPGMPGWRWIHTPGHTPGHISLFRESDRTLIVGDAFVTTRQESIICALGQPRQVHRPPAYYTIDWPSAHRSIIELTMLEPDAALAGHGKPMHGQQLREQLQELARGFVRTHMPRRGRYVAKPAIADDSGVVYVPPPVISTSALVAGVALAGVAAIAVVAAIRHRPARTSNLKNAIC